MNYLTKTLGRGLSTLANAAWIGVRAGDRLFPEKSFKPRWARSASVLTTRAWGGEISLRRCTRPPARWSGSRPGDAILFYAGGHRLSNNHGNGNGHEPLARKVAITKLPSLRDNARL